MTESIVSEESFSLTFAIENFPRFTKQVSPAEKHCGLNWHMEAHNKSPDWTLLLSARKDEGERQRRSYNQRRRLEIEYSFFFTSPREMLIESGIALDFDPSKVWYSDTIPMNFKGTKDMNMVGNTVTVRCDVTVCEIVLQLTPKFDFSIPNEQLVTDVVLVVENREFHVSKAVLASFSTYFKTMFYEKFRESDESRVVLKEVDADGFQVLLEVIYHKANVTEKNAEELLELAAYFDMKDIISQCEQVLINCSPKNVELSKKLLLADKYMLSELMKHIMENMKTVEQIQRVCPEKANNLNPSTIEEILQKVLDLRPI